MARLRHSEKRMQMRQNSALLNGPDCAKRIYAGLPAGLAGTACYAPTEVLPRGATASAAMACAKDANAAGRGW